MYTARPNSKESEDDILKLQEEFLKKKAENYVTPAAKVSSENKNQLNSEVEQGPSVANPQSQLENTFESIPTDINIGKIAEKTSAAYNAPQTSFVHRKGFPQAKRRDPTVSGSKKESIFSQQMKRLKKNPQTETAGLINAKPSTVKENQPMDTSFCCKIDLPQPMDVVGDNLQTSRTNPTTSKSFPPHSYIITGEEKEDIHQQNVGLLEQMTEQEILEERQKLLATMDPAIVAFLKAKRTNNSANGTVSIADQNKAAENITVEDVLASKTIVNHPDSEKWLNFETVEPGKLAWMTNIDIPKCEKGQSYEARFDFGGWLLPFSQPQIDENNRSLYHHGEEPGRPGYTLQELFQLCRSSINQQKIVALNTIANILSLHQSGVYDEVIEIPFEQIFFVLRFCLDDNTPAILNASIKATRNLFFYPIDETCLDNLLGFGLGMLQPCIAVDSTEVDDDNTVNDQQLAETNLVKCLARTDILKRIRYIINTVRPSTETIVYCLEILIRLARDSSFIVKQILNCEGLLESIGKHFIPDSIPSDNSQSAYGCPLQQAVKLFRILSTRNKDIATKLTNKYKIMHSVAAYLSNESLSAHSTGLKLQIETLHLWCVLTHYELGLEYFRDLEPILWRMLDFHVRNTNVQPTTSYVIQGHVAALLNLLAEALKTTRCDMAVFVPILSGLAALKWTTQLGSLEEFTCGKLQIVSGLLKCLDRLSKYKLTDVQAAALEDVVAKLLVGKGFAVVTENVRLGSNLLSTLEAHKSNPNLKTLEAAIYSASDHIVPTIHTHSCLPFLNVLSEFIANSHNYQMKLDFLKHKNIHKHLKSLNNAHSFSLVNNWFTRLETQLIANLLKISVDVQKDVETASFYEIAVKCLSVFNSEQKRSIEFVLTNIVFSPRFYPCESLMDNLDISESNELLKTALDNLPNIFSVYAQVLNIKMEERANLCVESSKGNIMPVDWIYSPIILLYSNQQQNKSSAPEERQIFIVTNCLRWIYIYEMYFPTLAKLINPTDRFCRIACTFLGSDTLFLNSEIHSLLEACLKHLLGSSEKNINFSKPIQGLNNFQDFYTQLLEQYQGVSYGDVLFGNFILLPLIQRHDAKYRKILWSEYAGVVQIFNVTAEQVLCPTEFFLNPPETDVSLLKCYRKALVMGAVRKHSLLYQIAKHHVEAFITKKSMERVEKV